MNKYQVTYDQLKELANDVYEGKLSWAEYDKYEIILEIPPNHSNGFINSLINKTCVEVEDQGERLLYRGIARNGIRHEWMKENGFKVMYEWCEFPYREVFVSEQDKAIVTACEGDITVSLHLNVGSFDSEMKQCEEAYVE